MTEARDIDMLGYCRSQTGRHLMLVVRSPSEVINPLLFFLLVIILFPLGLGPDPQQLSVLAPGILWVVALLANLMICMRLFVDDFEDGSLEQLAMARIPLAVAVLPQLVASWLASGLLLSLISPLFGLMLGLPLSVAPVLVASLLMGTAIMLLLGAVGASLTVGVQRGGILLALLILPLYVPVLIAGTRALNEAVQGGDPTIALALLGAGVTSGLMLAPLAIAAGVRVSLEL